MKIKAEVSLQVIVILILLKMTDGSSFKSKVKVIQGTNATNHFHPKSIILMRCVPKIRK